MNQILVRTNAGEYQSGQTVYGTVYLNIINPTAGCGVRLKFRGYEQFSYGLGRGADTHIPLISDKKDYIDCSDIILYKSSSPISIGSYVFPFQFSLLHEIPGSFSAGGGGDVRWEAGVEYWVQAEMIGAETIKVIQPVMVLQKMCHTQQAEVAECKIRGLLGLVNKNFSITARILEQSHRVMGYANLRLLISNQSSVKVKSILVKLKRELLLCTKYSSSTPLLAYPQIQRTDRKVWIQPEQEEATVWEHSISGDMGGVLNRGMDKLRVPLFTGRNQPIPPTTQGAHVQCRYRVEATAVLSSGQSCSITVPVYSILPQQNQQWCGWERPDWVNSRLTVMPTLPPFSVQPHVLYGEAFAGLPPFQNL